MHLQHDLLHLFIWGGELTDQDDHDLTKPLSIKNV